MDIAARFLNIQIKSFNYTIFNTIRSTKDFSTSSADNREITSCWLYKLYFKGSNKTIIRPLFFICYLIIEIKLEHSYFVAIVSAKKNPLVL